ncbi:hypothetical protein LMJF_22_0350 [Leishmania major strain Friedlin]|uniref:Uncharacterized protein n=1 Tax=Leishmania major TaxID=5664 RepID=Q4QBW0_LEIMA|nr:hypothetical protein LMJF_22_0350 [Leishmania major strain Friedlin]CAG9573903.1 hypothetical_protein_-_conserved [Leishmania major strain Friedlin]CAJ04015.1 hypothetical protein LMJF_22_0350 [Leishmania major strain Friedlin]|eukprot:XP_001683188.1 hypothetical protein LMJF_22_0350 [Leishmania major strain Friedlin]
MDSAASGVHLSAEGALPEELQTFMTELGRLEAVSKSRAQELARAKATERALSEQLAAVTYVAQKARHARLQLELDAAATQVRTEGARREAAEDRKRLSHITAQLKGVEARSISLDTQNEEGQDRSCHDIPREVPAGKRATAITGNMATLPNTFAGDHQLYRSLNCIHRHPRLSNLLLAPLVRLLRELGAQYTAALDDKSLAERVAPPLHSLCSLDAFQVWLRERACGALTDEDVRSLLFIANVADRHVAG